MTDLFVSNYYLPCQEIAALQNIMHDTQYFRHHHPRTSLTVWQHSAMVAFITQVLLSQYNSCPIAVQMAPAAIEVVGASLLIFFLPFFPEVFRKVEPWCFPSFPLICLYPRAKIGRPSERGHPQKHFVFGILPKPIK